MNVANKQCVFNINDALYRISLHIPNLDMYALKINLSPLASIIVNQRFESELLSFRKFYLKDSVS